jgi:ATP-dependent helicase/nuclease subunit B
MTSREHGQRWVPLGERLIEALRDEIAAARSDDPLSPITIVLPSFHSAFFMRRRLASDGPLFNVQFLRVEDLADALAGPADPRPPLSRLRASEIIHAVANDETVVLPEAFRRIRGQDGFQRALHRTLDDLDASGVDPAVVAGTGGGPTRWKFTSAVLGLFARYRERAGVFASASDVAARAAESVRANVASLDRFGLIVLALIEEPAAQHRELITALLGRPATRVVIGATGDHDSDRLLSQAPGVLPSPYAEVDSSTRSGSSGFRFVSAPDPAEEARWIVRDVLSAAREGTRFARIGVFFEEPSYGARLTGAFQLSGVPVSGPSPVTLANTPGGRWILGLLAFLDRPGSMDQAGDGDSRFARDRMAAWVTGSHVVAADGDPAAGAAWDVISRRAGVIAGVGSWDRRLGEHARRLRVRAEKAARQDEDDDASRSTWITEANESDRLREFVAQLAAEQLPAERNASWGDFVTWLKALQERYGRAGALEPDGDEAAQALNSALDAISDLDSIDLPSPTFQRFRRTLEQELDRSLSRVGRLGSGVFVAPLRQAVGCDFDLIYVVGMAEGSYPTIGSEDPLLPDIVRNGVPGLKTLGDERASARRRYLTALGSAPQRVLVWPRSQPGATRQVWRSRWFSEAAEAVHGKPLPANLLDTENGPVEIVPTRARQTSETQPADRYEYELKSLAAWGANGLKPEDHFLFTAPGETLSSGRELERGRFQTRQLTRWDGAVGPNVGHEETWSAASLTGVASSTRLETWANCPFRYFLTYEIGVEPTEAPEAAETLSALDRGIIIHDILDRFVKNTLNQPAASAAIDAERLQQIANRQLDEFEHTGLIGRPVLWRLERERIKRGLLDFLDVHRSRIDKRGQRPVATELGFGVGTEIPAVVLKLPGGRAVRFRGWIDRVDVSADGSAATVIDYKSGRGSRFSRIANDPVDGGKHLQLPIYAMAVKGWRPEIESIAAEFWFVMDSAGSKTVGTSLEIATPRFEEVIDQIVSGIEEGIFPAYPGERSIPGRSGVFAQENCAYCPYDRICPGGRAWAWERKSDDPALARFIGLASGGSSDGSGADS